MSEGERWCVLTVRSANTLALARSLAAAGFEVWTPEETLKQRRPQSQRREGAPAYRERQVAVMPTIVFARERHIHELRLIIASPISRHPAFAFFPHYRGTPIVSDQSVGALKAYEAKKRDALASAKAAEQRRAEVEAQKRARKLRRAVPIGAEANVPDSAFRGVVGIVEASDGRDAYLRYGRMRLKVDAWKLIGDELDSAPTLA